MRLHRLKGAAISLTVIRRLRLRATGSCSSHVRSPGTHPSPTRFSRARKRAANGLRRWRNRTWRHCGGHAQNGRTRGERIGPRPPRVLGASCSGSTNPVRPDTRRRRSKGDRCERPHRLPDRLPSESATKMGRADTRLRIPGGGVLWCTLRRTRDLARKYPLGSPYIPEREPRTTMNT